MSRPILPILASYLMGLIAGYWFSVPFHILIALTFISLSFTAASILFKKAPALFFILSMLTLSILGVARMNAVLNPLFPDNHITNIISDEPMSLEGRISEPLDRGLDKTRAYVALSAVYRDGLSFPVTGRLLLSIGGSESVGEAHPTILKYGDKIRFLAKVKRPRSFHNPGAFNTERQMALNGVFATAYLKDAEGVVKTGEGISSFGGWIEGMREGIRENVFKNGGTFAPVLLALVTGEQGEISKDVRDAFSRAGTAHILAISGEHIGIIALFSFAIILRLLKRSERVMLHINIYKAAALMTIPVIALYSMIAGSGFSIVRAAIMGGAALLAVLFDRRRDIPSLISFAAFLILALEPEALFDISFQLSFASVISLATIYPYLETVLAEEEEADMPVNRISRLLAWLKVLFLITLAAAIGTTPLVAFYFNRLSIISPISNLIIVPIVGFIVVPLGLISSILLPLSQTISAWIITADSHLISYIVRLTSFFASIPLASIRVVTPNIFEIPLFYLAVASFIYRKEFRWARRLIIPALCILTALESFYFFKPYFQKELRITFLDVGQGESALVEFPGGRRMLIDGGGLPKSDFDIGERVVAPFLWHKKIRTIDYVSLSHPNSDHYGGLPFILRNFNIGEIWESGIEEKSAGYIDFKMAVRDSGGIHRKVGDGDSIAVCGTTVETMNPPKGYKTTSDRDANNGSLVMKVKFGETSFLFTGDIEKEAEAMLLSKGNELKCTVLKAPHHGSLTSSTVAFLDKVRPDMAIFSVGYRNHFGFPKDAVVKRYRDINAGIFRTDRDGAIVATTDGVNARLFKSLNSY